MGPGTQEVLLRVHALLVAQLQESSEQIQKPHPDGQEPAQGTTQFKTLGVCHRDEGQGKTVLKVSAPFLLASGSTGNRH